MTTKKQKLLTILSDNFLLKDRIATAISNTALGLRQVSWKAQKESDSTFPDAQVIVCDLSEIDQSNRSIRNQIRKIIRFHPKAQLILLLRDEDTEILRPLLELGLYQYAKIPVSDEELRILVETAFFRFENLENTPTQSPTMDIRIPGILGRSSKIRQALHQIKQASEQNISVLLLGETGTGKDIAAQAIHQLSARSSGPFVPVNLGALPSDLVASELFGHEKGSFTGAVRQSSGRFEQARGGTIFLDEIDSINEKVQLSLLRLLEQKAWFRIGGTRKIRSDSRIIAACNVSFNELLQRKTFRNDLLFRLDVFRINLPPLRERRGDIKILTNYFLRKFSHELNRNVSKMTPECRQVLMAYDWPGNVRELKNVVQRAVLISKQPEITLLDLPVRFHGLRTEKSHMLEIKMGTTLIDAEKKMIIRALDLTGNHRTKTADLLGISRRALYNKLQKHGLL